MKGYILGSGSKGNSTLLEFDNIKILIDIGFSYRYIKEKLEEINILPSEINYIFITHDHTDHIYGLEVFIKKHKPIVYVNNKLNISYLENYSNAILLNKDIKLNDISIKVIQTSHDAPDSKGFVFEQNNESLVYITDTGYINHRYFKYLENKTYYIIESNHDIEMLMNCRYPHYLKQRIYGDSGHLSNKACSNYLSKLIGPNTKKVALAHLSENSNTSEIALDTLKNTLEETGVLFNNIEAAKQREIVVVND